LALILGAYGRAAAQAPNAAAPAEQAASSAAQAATLSADGELLEVDAKANTITIKTTNTPEMKFKYDTTTKVTGGDKGVAGLATMKGSQVTVQYKRDGATNTATSIMVKPASGAAPRTESPRAPESPQPRPEPRPEAPRPDSPTK